MIIIIWGPEIGNPIIKKIANNSKAPVDVIIAPRGRGQAAMGSHDNVGICRGKPTKPGRHVY